METIAIVDTFDFYIAFETKGSGEQYEAPETSDVPGNL
jgi:hypothetical protein